MGSFKRLVDSSSAACDLAYLRGTPGGDRLSPEMLVLLALIVFDGYEFGAKGKPMIDRDPSIQDSTEFAKDVSRNRLRYENPRGLPQKWVQHYLSRERGQLALDVMRSFDQTWKVEERLNRAKTWSRIQAAALAASWAVILLLGKYILEHVK